MRISDWSSDVCSSDLKGFTPEDVYERGRRTLEKCILNGTTHMRTQLEVDPGTGLRGLEGILPLIEAYKWALDVEICVFPQERSEERRVGKECVSKCRSRWWPDH